MALVPGITAVSGALSYCLHDNDNITDCQVPWIATHSLPSQTEHVITHVILVVFLHEIDVTLHTPEETDATSTMPG